jgi:hypothetical protein
VLFFEQTTISKKIWIHKQRQSQLYGLLFVLIIIWKNKTTQITKDTMLPIILFSFQWWLCLLQLAL